jgi:hypothetical protein
MLPLLLMLSLARDSTAASRALHDPKYHWITRRTEHLELHAKANSALASALRDLGEAAERAVTWDLRILGERSSGARMHLFFVASRAEMVPLVGAGPGGHAVVAEGTAFLVANDSVHPPLRHELMHLLSWRLWGTPAGEWVSEGLATFAAGCGNHDMNDVAAALARANRLAPFSAIRHTFVFAGEAGAANYFQAASMIAFTRSTYGVDRLRTFWSTGLAASGRSLGVEAAVLEAQWRAAIDRRTASATWQSVWREVLAHGCE